LGNMFFITPDAPFEPVEPVAPVRSSGSGRTKSYSYSYSNSEAKAAQLAGGAYKKRSKNVNKSDRDSVRTSSNEKIMEAAKNFIADYGDLLTQLPPNERIVITNKTDNNLRMVWVGDFDRGQKRSLLSVEGNKADINQFRQGKITRDQLLGKLKVISAETDDDLQPDLELMSSILNKLYSRDLSKTFYTEDDISYERLKDFGVIYYVQVYSSDQVGNDLWNLPTLRLEEVDSPTRNKKVKEMYPQFEKEIMEDMLEYGRTLKSLKPDESLMLNITLTRCPGCAIPSSLELSVKNSVLQDYSSGKITKETALTKIIMKKGADQ